MGRDLHLFAEYFDEELGSWTTIAEFHCPRHIKLFNLLIAEAEPMQIVLHFELNDYGVETYAALTEWQADMHHFHIMEWSEFTAFKAMVGERKLVGSTNTYLNAVHGVLLDFYAQLRAKTRIVYWFDN